MLITRVLAGWEGLRREGKAGGVKNISMVVSNSYTVYYKHKKKHRKNLNDYLGTLIAGRSRIERNGVLGFI